MRIFAAVCSLALFGLQPAQPWNPTEECTVLLEEGRHEDTILLCQPIFERTGDPRAGLAVANAQEQLGRTDEALAWVERLAGTSEAAEAWRLARRIYFKLGDLQREKEANLRELALRRTAGDHSRAAEINYRRFYFAWKAASFREALDFARQSLEDAVIAGNRELEVQALLALATILQGVGDLERAVAVLDQAARLLAPEQRSERARLRVSEGLIQLKAGRPALARDAFERARAEADPGADFEHGVAINLIAAHLLLGELEAADELWHQARRRLDPQLPWPTEIRYYQARILSERGDVAAAKAVLETALGQDPDPAWQWELELQLGGIEESLGRPRAAEAAYRRAISVVESLRAATGRDDLKARLADDSREPYEALFRRLAHTGRHREALALAEDVLARTFLEALLHARDEPARAEVGTRAILGAAAERLDAIEALLPSAIESPISVPRPLEETLAFLRDRSVIVFFEAGDEWWRIVISGGQVRAEQVPASAAEMRERVQRFLDHPDELAPSWELADLLLPPPALPEPGPLVIVADGVLGRVPFAALWLRTRYLVEDYTLAEVPSLQALVAIEGRPETRLDAPVVVGDPRGDLPRATLEVEEVAARLGVPALRGRAATRGQLRLARRAAVLHVASHTGLGPRGAWLALHDGKVAADRIVVENIAPRLVILAGCASGVRTGRGMWGSLGAAFLVAGSRTVMASLESVEDTAAGELVQRFYAEGGAVDPVGALARAQRQLLAAGRPASAWAPFVVLGSDRPYEAFP